MKAVTSTNARRILSNNSSGGIGVSANPSFWCGLRTRRVGVRFNDARCGGSSRSAYQMLCHLGIKPVQMRNHFVELGTPIKGVIGHAELVPRVAIHGL